MRSVLITGGTGTLGHALTETLLSGEVERLCILSRDEFKQHEMAQRFTDPRLRFFLGDVRDRTRLGLAMRGIDTVIHCAALKQVPALEYSPSEAIMTNVMGAMNVVGAALEQNVGRVLAVSTDKASQPVTLYGATKLCMEKLMTAANAYSGAGGPRFSCVRYGNVAGSRGSVIPFWQRCIAEGRALPITDTRMTRFWIRIDEAVALVMRSLDRMEGGEVFIPKIPSFWVMDLAAAFGAHASSHIGIRPGEKLHETLIGRDEAMTATDLSDDYALLPAGRLMRRLPDGFEYSSETAMPRLTVAQLRDELQQMRKAA